MSVLQRLSTILQARANKARQKGEDPRATLDSSYEHQLEQLEKVRRSVADMATSRKRVELQAAQLQAAIDKLEAQARDAVMHGNEDVARQALTRKQTAATQLASVSMQHDQLVDQQAKLVDASNRLQARVDAFRTHKEMLKATYTAAEAETKVGEAVTGISEEMPDLGLAVQRAEDETAQMQARAGAIDELLASGALDDATAPGDAIQPELDKAQAGGSVDRELTRLRAKLPAPAEIEARNGD
ncbi:MAG: PspA/IM30 family protein [Acidimicrobiaceae bacterium]|nr:PspA/IM30 family protein [Acidimicrobiaceae bacterium]